MRVCAVVVWWCVALLHEENEDAAHEQVKGVEGLRVSQAGEHQRRGGGRGHAGRFQPAGRSGGDYARVKRPQTSHQADTWSAPSLGPASLRQRKRQRRRSSRPANHIGGSRSEGAPRFSVNSSRSLSVSLSGFGTLRSSPPRQGARYTSQVPCLSTNIHSWRWGVSLERIAQVCPQQTVPRSVLFSTQCTVARGSSRY